MGNIFGNIFKLTSYGESHGKLIGGVIDGCPSNIELNIEEIQKELERRRPGQSVIVTQRKEEDKVVFHSGIFDGKTTGTPIAFVIKNKDQKSKDYSHNKDVFRPSHADYTYQQKYGIRDHNGGGRSSARETAVRVVAGAIAKQILLFKGVTIQAYVSKVGSISLTKSYQDLDLSKTNDNNVKCPDKDVAVIMESLIKTTKAEGDTIGGMITCVIKNTPVGIGEPVFDRLNAELAKAMFSINAVKGFELGSGFSCVDMKGSDHNDEFFIKNNKVKTKTNNSGGIQGGISNGEDIYFNVAFKPVATIIMKQSTINISCETVDLIGKGRHDPCVVPRAVPIVEAMSALVILDYLMMKKSKVL